MKLSRFVRANRAAPAVNGAVSVSDVEREFYGSWAQGDRYWWYLATILLDPNDCIVEGDDGELYRLEYTFTDTEVTFGAITPVRIEYVDAVARSEANQAAVAAIVNARGPEKVAAVYTERPTRRPQAKEGDNVRQYIEKMRAKLHLSADLSDEEVLRLAAEATPEAQDPEDPGTPDPNPTPDPPTGDPPPPSPPDDEPPAQQPAAGAVLVPAAALATLQTQAALGASAHERMERESDERWLDREVLGKGRVPGATRASYLSQMEYDRKTGVTHTRDFLTSLAENVVPVSARAVTPTSEEEQPQYDTNAFLAAHMPDVAARKARQLAAAGAGPRVMSDE